MVAPKAAGVAHGAPVPHPGASCQEPCLRAHLPRLPWPYLPAPLRRLLPGIPACGATVLPVTCLSTPRSGGSGWQPPPPHHHPMSPPRQGTPQQPPRGKAAGTGLLPAWLGPNPSPCGGDKDLAVLVTRTWRAQPPPQQPHSSGTRSAGSCAGAKAKASGLGFFLVMPCFTLVPSQQGGEKRICWSLVPPPVLPPVSPGAAGAPPGFSPPSPSLCHWGRSCRKPGRGKKRRQGQVKNDPI